VTALIATLRREMASLWLTPLAWILWLALLLLEGGVFASIVTSFATNAGLTLDVGPLQAFYGQSIFVPLTFLFVCPTLSMRSFAEERRTGTIENLLSAPVSSAAIVVGKYLALLLSFIVLWLPTLLYPLVLRSVMQVEWKVVLTSYLGIFGLGAGFLAIGVLCSTMTRSQFLSLVLTSGVLLAFIVLGVGENVFDTGFLQALCSHVAIQSQLTETAQGIVSARRVIFDITLITVPIFLAIRVVDSWRWS
jgi:ABC-2 type transport system permease protein